MKKNKIAIACQGGGSQTAFTAGVLKGLLQNKINKTKQIVSFSGTSGGAVCAALSWYSILKEAKGDTTPVEERLVTFWKENSTQNMIEELFNDFFINYSQSVEYGLTPEWHSSPSSFYSQSMLSTFKAMLPRRHFYDFKELLESKIDFDEIETLTDSSSPALLIGAANVLTGNFKKFNSRKNEIKVESVLASAAVPSIFPAVEIGEHAYWDGLFSDNPPTDELTNSMIVGENNLPDEIWVIQINPKSCNTIPKSAEEIQDRRNEMIGNGSLFHDLHCINLINKYIKEGAFTEAFLKKNNYKYIPVYIIAMPGELQEKLGYSSKLNRSAKYIEELMDAGEKQADLFLKNPEKFIYESFFNETFGDNGELIFETKADTRSEI